MIDDIQSSLDLMERLRAALPITAEFSPPAYRALRGELRQPTLPRRCQVTDVTYAGDEGGIVCTLALGHRIGEGECVISITHLNFAHGNPLCHDIRTYKKRRIRRLRQLDGGSY